MAEFLDHPFQILEAPPSIPQDQGFGGMGRSIPLYRRDSAFDHCKMMGMTNVEDILSVVEGMSAQLERDEPYKAMSIAMGFLDLTGTYRIMAALLCD